MRRRDGFTLVEILVVMAILGLLMVFVAFKIRGALPAARRQTALGRIQQLSTALDRYAMDHNSRLPTQAEGLQHLTSSKVPGSTETYLSTRDLVDPWGNPYGYQVPGRQGTFDVICYGSDGQPGGQDDAADFTDDDIGPQ